MAANLIHPHTDHDCPICDRPAGKCTGNQCMATVNCLGGDVLVCHDEQHDGDTHRMEQIESYDVNDPEVGNTYRASRMVEVRWHLTDRTVGDILAEVEAQPDRDTCTFCGADLVLPKGGKVWADPSGTVRCSSGLYPFHVPEREVDDRD